MLRWLVLPKSYKVRSAPLMPQVAKVLAALRHRELHDLRHSFGTMAVRVPITDVQTWMGHADIATTRKYGHYAPQPGAAKRLGALIDEQLGQVVPIRPAA